MTEETENDTQAGEVKPRSLARRLLRFLVRLVIWVVGFFVFVFGGAWLWFESSSSDVVLAQKAEAFLEEGLGRDVSIGDLSLRPGLPAKLVVANVKLANDKEAERENQVTLSKVELRLSLRSLLKGEVRISDVVLVDPVFVLEILPDGDGIRTNVPRWLGPKSEDQKDIDLNVDTIALRNGRFEFIDHVHDLGVVAERIDAEVEPDLKNLKDPRLTSEIEIGTVRFRASTIEFPPFHAEGRARFQDGIVQVERFAGEGRAVTVMASGPISADRLDLDATLHADLAELRESLGLGVPLEGLVDAKGTVSGPYSNVGVEGTFESPLTTFDVYSVATLSGEFRTVERGFEVVANQGSIAGGRVSARYALSFREGEPRNLLEIEHEGISMDALLPVWGIENAGLSARGTGQLRMAWDEGPPEEGLSGSATLVAEEPEPTNEEKVMPVAGRVAYRLAGGSLFFEPLAVEGGSTSIELTGSIGLKNETLDLRTAVETQSLDEVDRLWARLARSFGQKDWQLLGIRGRGLLDAMVAGTTTTPRVEIEVHADGFMFGSLDLERADGRVVFDGKTQDLIFENARFENGQGEIVLNDTIGLKGEELDLGLTVSLHDWPTESILQFLELEFPVRGSASGIVTVKGHPSTGEVTFAPLEIRDGSSTIKLAGDTAWTPQEKGLAFNLDVGLVEVAFDTIAGVLDLGSDLPLSGNATGTVHMEGPLTDIAGAGSITLDRGTVLGEPFELIASDLVINEGVFRLKNLDIRLPGGFVRGEAKYDFAQDRFGYVIDSSEIEIARLKGYPRLRNVFTGTLFLSSSGGGTIKHPEIVLDARVKDAVLLDTPVTEPGANLYATLRNGEYSIKGSVGDTIAVNGTGHLDLDTSAVDGDISITISNIASVTKKLEKRTGFSTSGQAKAHVRLGGHFSPVDQFVVDGTIEQIDLKVANYTVRTAEPAKIRLDDGTVSVDRFRLMVDDQSFSAHGSVALDTGAINMQAEGLVGAGILAVAMPDVRATGDIAISFDIGGTFDDPMVEGTAEVRKADFRILGFPQAFRDVQSTLVLSGNVIEIDSFSSRLGGGQVNAGGRIELEEGVPNRVRINMTGDDVDLRLSQGLSVAGNFDFVIAGNPADRMLVKGEADLTRVLYTKDVEIGTAIVDFIVSRRAKIESVAQEWQSRVALDVEVKADDAIRVRNNMAKITGNADVRVSGTLANPVLLGRAVFDEGGTIRLSNVEYRVVNGSVNFQNPFRIDPYVDLTAEGRYRNEYDLTIVVTGTPDALQMSVASDPPIADLSILNVFGIPTSTSTGTVKTSDSVASAGGSIIDSSVGSLLGSRLAFADNLRLEGITGAEPKVTIEKAISDDIRAIVTYTMNDAGDNVEVIEWRATPRFVIQATRDSTKDTTYFINAVDISFSRRFGGQW